MEKCNFCALCPCPNIRADIIRAKTLFIERDGLKFGVRTVEDVERIGKLCGVMPGLINRLLRSEVAGGVIKEAVGIHRDRKLPEFPAESFPAWARKKGLHVKPNTTAGRKVAYFAGCTARHLFPEVAKATVEVLRHNDIHVYCPDHKCCGMPSFLEGDRMLTMEFAGHNLNLLADAVTDGFDILCSCPTCSYMLRHLLPEGAYYSREYQESIGADPKFIKVPARPKPGHAPGRNIDAFDKIIYKDILKDHGYFSSLNPLKRVALLEKTFDLGEYLWRLHTSGQLKTDFGPIQARAVYFPPCHQREQEFGQPYMRTLRVDSRPEAGRDPGQPLLLRTGWGHGVQAGFPPAFDRVGQPADRKNKGDEPGDPRDRLPELSAAVQPAPSDQSAPPGRNPLDGSWTPITALKIAKKNSATKRRGRRANRQRNLTREGSGAGYK